MFIIVLFYAIYVIQVTNLTLSQIQVEDKSKTDLKKRKLIEEVSIKSFDLQKGKAFALSLEKQETDLNSEMIVKGTWKGKEFKDYNFDALGVVPDKGRDR